MIRLDAVARQPLHLGTQPDAGWLTDTHRFIPGSVVRGALAASWLGRFRGPRPDTSSDDEFLRLFEGGLRYGPLYPSDDALRPLSVFGCKYACDGDAPVDAAFTEDLPARCPACGSPLEASRGSVTGGQAVENTRLELDRDGRAVEGKLFTRRALAAGTRLTGLVDGDLDAECGWLGEPDLLVRFGGRRSTSGLTELRATPVDERPRFDGYDPASRRLVLRMLSPGIFLDGLGRPSWFPDLVEIGTLLGVGTTVASAYLRPATVGGWHAASNLPKPRDFAVAAGSVFVLQLDGDPGVVGLDRLWRTGTGLRRAEGNGWVSLDRWRAPAPIQQPSRSARRRSDALVIEVLGTGVGAEFVSDLRAWAQTGGGSDAQAGQRVLLGARRYGSLGESRLNVLRKALDLPPDEAAGLAQRLSEYLVVQTSRRGARR
ncbi:type III-B CRISPR module-associated Cmr3 family protein [Pseudonocardia oroxyli]|uniref:CRISPR-associated protein Csx10 n=1 Tax=Pseudonocardia oroxyli TaxID=366584 RepID=A0A1G8CQX6_PSEOR|nr:type III-B CRISPR module-associated Cmr3 family protein [Pseudonocardia oroxyli]SDH47723.1 CRISPR-associated protein Csx10 [Pseudonocardia oroxyli]